MAFTIIFFFFAIDEITTNIMEDLYYNGGIIMITVLLEIVKMFLGFGVAGILIIIGLIAVVTWLIKNIISGISESWYRGKRKGGDE